MAKGSRPHPAMSCSADMPQVCHDNFSELFNRTLPRWAWVPVLSFVIALVLGCYGFAWSSCNRLSDTIQSSNSVLTESLDEHIRNDVTNGDLVKHLERQKEELNAVKIELRAHIARWDERWKQIERNLDTMVKKAHVHE